MEVENQNGLKISNGTSFNDVEWPLTYISTFKVTPLDNAAEYLRNGTRYIVTMK